MTQHLHSEHVEGCYRCDLSRHEVTSRFQVFDAEGREWIASLPAPTAVQWTLPNADPTPKP